MHRARSRFDVKKRAVTLATLAVATTLVSTACDTDDGRQMREPTQPAPVDDATASVIPGIDEVASTVPVEPTTPTADLALIAPWQNGEAIPALYTCDGDDVSPALRWSIGPDDTIEYAITIVDPDANNYVHWIVMGIDPAITSLEEGVVPPGVIVAANTAGEESYTGPCPPASETHNYVVTIYALSQQLELAGDESPRDLIILFQATALTTSSLSGTYSRQG